MWSLMQAQYATTAAGNLGVPGACRFTASFGTLLGLRLPIPGGAPVFPTSSFQLALGHQRKCTSQTLSSIVVVLTSHGPFRCFFFANVLLSNLRARSQSAPVAGPSTTSLTLSAPTTTPSQTPTPLKLSRLKFAQASAAALGTQCWAHPRCRVCSPRRSFFWLHAAYKQSHPRYLELSRENRGSTASHYT
ncbi:hypothetical protein IQ07DRAFT_62364 [Pyrenochaeta sp. DS3sAY3a]|nr:hypothetical protein IQ07DRAFT_62364 [Pyrenochaeta sp. DS3sAY3a]